MVLGGLRFWGLGPKKLQWLSGWSSDMSKSSRGPGSCPLGKNKRVGLFFFFTVWGLGCRVWGLGFGV